MVTTEAPVVIETPPETYQPTTAQLERAAALRRFNRLAVYLPVLLFALIALILFVLMLINALPNEGSQATRSLLSGLADIILIVTIIPLWLVLTLVPVGAIVLVVQMRQRDISPLRGLQTLFWRIESKLGQVQQKTEEVAPKAAAPVIKVNAQLSFVLTWLDRMRYFFRVNPNLELDNSHLPTIKLE